MSEQHQIPTALNPGLDWPAGNYVELAVLNVDKAYLHHLFGTRLIEGHEPGMGRWCSIGVRLESGAVIELIAYDNQPGSGFTLRANASDNLQFVLQEAMSSLGLDQSVLAWSSPLLASAGITARRRSVRPR